LASGYLFDGLDETSAERLEATFSAVSGLPERAHSVVDPDGRVSCSDATPAR
jgi:hypothetical protein